MARKKDAEDEPKVLVNDITGAIAKMNDRAYSLRNQIDAAMEKHVQPLKDELKALFRDTKAGYPSADQGAQAALQTLRDGARRGGR